MYKCIIIITIICNAVQWWLSPLHDVRGVPYNIPAVCKTMKKSTYVILYCYNDRRSSKGSKMSFLRRWSGYIALLSRRFFVVHGRRKCKAAQGDICTDFKTNDNEPRKKKWEKIHNMHSSTAVEIE